MGKEIWMMMMLYHRHSLKEFQEKKLIVFVDVEEKFESILCKFVVTQREP